MDRLPVAYTTCVSRMFYMLLSELDFLFLNCAHAEKSGDISRQSFGYNSIVPNTALNKVITYKTIEERKKHIKTYL